MSRTEMFLAAALLVAGCSSDGQGGGGGAATTSASTSAETGAGSSTTSSSTSTSTSSSTASSTSTVSTGEGGASGSGGGSDAGGAGGAGVDPAVCAAQLTEEDCYAAGCNAWLKYYELTIVADVCQSETIGPLCMNYTNPVGGAVYQAFVRTFEAELPLVIGDGGNATPDGWVDCGVPGTEEIRECCCYGGVAFPICEGLQTDLP